MLRFVKTRVAKGEFYSTKEPIKMWDVNVDNIFISKLVETKNNYKYLTRYLDQVIRPLVWILPKMSEHSNTSKDNSRDKNNQLMSLPIYNDKLLEKYKIFWTKI